MTPSRGTPPEKKPLLAEGAAWLLRGLRLFRVGWKRFWSWRRISFSRGGLFFCAGAFAVGFAAINTGNNLLYLLLGAMLGFIVISSWLSEQVIGGVRVTRPTPALEQDPGNVQHTSSGLLHLTVDIPGQAFIPFLKAGQHADARSENRFVRRGVFPLEAITVSTSFPFGLFRKSLSLRSGGELVIWPRTDRRVRTPAPGGGRNPSSGSVALGSAGPRGEYRGLREFRPGDDPKDIHWRTTARLGAPVVREYEQNDAETLWVCLDARGEPGEGAEAAVETAASLVARAFQEGKRFGYAGPAVMVEAGQGPGQLERILDALARVDFKPNHPKPQPPVHPRQCVLVTLSPARRGNYGDFIVPSVIRQGAEEGAA